MMRTLREKIGWHPCCRQPGNARIERDESRSRRSSRQLDVDSLGKTTTVDGERRLEPPQPSPSTGIRLNKVVPMARVFWNSKGTGEITGHGQGVLEMQDWMKQFLSFFFLIQC